MAGTVKYEYKEAGYGLIYLQRVEKHHAISKKMIDQLNRSLNEAKKDDIKCLVITATGDKMFCAGGDLNYFHGKFTPDEAFARLYPMKELLFEIASFPVPTICLLNGDALGGGCEIATACDIRIARKGTQFGFIQADMGILPGWGGGTLLYEKVQKSFALQWLMEANVYTEYELQEREWIHKVVPNQEWKDLDNILQPYINKSLEQMKLLKRQYTTNISILGLSAQMSEEVRQCANLWDSEEHQLKCQAFFTR